MMSVLAKEVGERPVLMTQARRFAPAAVVHLGRLFEQENFADSVVILLDWNGDVFWDTDNGPMPPELAKPAIHVVVEKSYPQYKKENRLTLDMRLDIEEMFGHDNATPDDLQEVVNAFKEQVRKQEARRTI